MTVRHVLVVAASLLLSFALVGCKEDNPLDPGNTDLICRDGVEYMKFEKTSYSTSGNFSFSMSVVPNFKADGSLYTCANPKPATTN